MTKRTRNKPAFPPARPQPAPVKLENKTTNIQIKQHQGPLPSVEYLQELDAIVPGSAKLIVDLFEKQAIHRMSLESTAVKAGSRDSLLGIISAFTLCALCIIGAFFCIIKGYPTGGTILGSTGTLGFASAFIYGTRVRSRERIEKAKMHP